MAAKKTRLHFEVIPVSEVPTEDAAPERTKSIVLVVDDERIIADTLSMILARSGFSTLTAYDGLVGFEIAQRAKPDLIISDVVMPGMTGVELAIAVTQMIPACKILLFSGQAATVDLLKDARNIGHDFTTLTKPVHPTDMLKRVAECLATPSTTFTHAHSRTDDSSRPATYLVN
jgi:CheY-like chemotaxis protein